MAGVEFDPVKNADEKLKDALDRSNILTTAIAWIIFPDYRKYLKDPLVAKCRRTFLGKIFNGMHERFVHAMRKDRQGQQTVQERDES